MDWIAYAYQGPEASVQAALNALRAEPGGAHLIRPEEGAPLLAPVVAIPGHATFGFALPADVPEPEVPAGCFVVERRLAPVAISVGGEQG